MQAPYSLAYLLSCFGDVPAIAGIPTCTCAISTPARSPVLVKAKLTSLGCWGYAFVVGVCEAGVAQPVLEWILRLDFELVIPTVAYENARGFFARSNTALLPYVHAAIVCITRSILSPPSLAVW